MYRGRAVASSRRKDANVRKQKLAGKTLMKLNVQNCVGQNAGKSIRQTSHQSSPIRSGVPRLALGAALSLCLCGPAHGATFRWASSSNRIYVEGGGSATLTD